jgi:hypothetical protein
MREWQTWAWKAQQQILAVFIDISLNLSESLYIKAK